MNSRFQKIATLTSLYFNVYGTEQKKRFLFCIVIIISGFITLSVNENNAQNFLLYQALVFVYTFFSFFYKGYPTLTDFKDIYILYNKPGLNKNILWAKSIFLITHDYWEKLAYLVPVLIYTASKSGFKAALPATLNTLANAYLFSILITCFYLTLIYLSPTKFLKNTFIAFNVLALIAASLATYATFTNGHFLWLTNYRISIVLASASACILALVIPVFSSTYTRKLLRLEQLEKNYASKSILLNLIANAGSGNEVWKSGFVLGWKETGLSKDFNLRALPVLINMLVVEFISMKNVHDIMGFRHIFQTVFSYYMLLIPFFYILSLHVFSANAGAAWIFKITPHSSRHTFRLGIFASLYTKYCLPVQLALSAVGIFFLGKPVIKHLVLINTVLPVTCLVAFLVLLRETSFSSPYAKTFPLKTFGFIIIALVLTAILSFVHLQII